jgi:cytoplasmic iron level regulating protein YaaA (DUF328/UPF0246 family)
MLVVISPAKKLDWTRAGDAPWQGRLQPRFQDAATELAGLARQVGADGLRKLMDLSPALAQLNAERFAAFRAVPDPAGTRAAVLGFAGDTYVGLHAPSMDAAAADRARGHLRMLSGLYGVLRPEDQIQPHRLEMGTRLANARGRDLYAFWGDRIARMLAHDARETGARHVLNCASREYFGAVDLAALGLPVITPVFLDRTDDGEDKVISFHAKRARGAMARFVLENRVLEPGDLREFDWMGYRWQDSPVDAPVFLRATQG